MVKKKRSRKKRKEERQSIVQPHRQQSDTAVARVLAQLLRQTAVLQAGNHYVQKRPAEAGCVVPGLTPKTSWWNRWKWRHVGRRSLKGMK